MHDSDTINKFINLSSPIIKDNGHISALFNALPEDFIIIDRDLTIKFKYHLTPKSLIYKEMLKWTFNKDYQSNHLTDSDIARAIQNITYNDVFNKTKKAVKHIKNKYVILTSFTSTCTSCEETFRVEQLKKLSENLDRNKAQVLFLFGKGNNAEALREYGTLNDWNKFSITTGIIEETEPLTHQDYFQIFQLDTDPKTFIIDTNGEIVFRETPITSKMINSDFLNKQIK